MGKILDALRVLSVWALWFTSSCDPLTDHSVDSIDNANHSLKTKTNGSVCNHIRTRMRALRESPFWRLKTSPSQCTEASEAAENVVPKAATYLENPPTKSRKKFHVSNTRIQQTPQAEDIKVGDTVEIIDDIDCAYEMGEQRGTFVRITSPFWGSDDTSVYLGAWVI